MSGGQDDLQALRDLVDERAAAMAEFDARERALVKRLRELNVGSYYSYLATPWADIAQALGVSRQAVMKRHADALAQGNPTSYRHRRRYDAGRSRS